ncbi:MAG: hypothetical protein WB561_19555 [Terracidiphilus sp.]
MYESQSPDLTHKSQQPNLPMKRRWGITACAALSAMLCTGASSPTGCSSGSSSFGNIGPSSGEIVGAAFGVGAVIAVAIIVPVEISRSHHTLNGCVVTGEKGLELRTSDAKTYSLEGDAASIKVGDKIKIHGSKIKKTKDSTGPQVFKVEMLTKDFGPCPVTAAAAAVPAH